jgi:hypothetical protein
MLLSILTPLIYTSYFHFLRSFPRSCSSLKVRDRTFYLRMVLARVSDFPFTIAQCLRFIDHHPGVRSSDLSSHQTPHYSNAIAFRPSADTVAIDGRHVPK